MRTDTKIKGQEALTIYLPTVQAMTNYASDAINAAIKRERVGETSNDGFIREFNGPSSTATCISKKAKNVVRRRVAVIYMKYLKKEQKQALIQGKELHTTLCAIEYLLSIVTQSSPENNEMGMCNY